MSYQVLARKWRPRIFREMVGQEHVLQALINALDHDRLHHAYLFTGTRGVGKTTIARILAKCLNCEVGVSSAPCNECPSCVEINEGRFVDLIEVDAASRTKVEDTRELLENVQYAPTRGRYKVYLIDEVHMLSNSSFNALLKTLEEPPPHVKFLLATTDPQKLPVTILSRCLQFNLKNMSPERIVNHLEFVLGEESVPFEEAGLWQLARAADGSMRDALSLTDQSIAFGDGKITDIDVRTMLGTIDQSLVYKVIEGLISEDPQQVLKAVAELAEHAPDYPSALAELIAVLHRIAIAQVLPEAVDNSHGDREKIYTFAQAVSAEDTQLYYQTALLGRRDLPLNPDPRSGFEMVLLRMLAFKPQGVTQLPEKALTATVPAPTIEPMPTSEAIDEPVVKAPVIEEAAPVEDAVKKPEAEPETHIPDKQPEKPLATVVEKPLATLIEKPLATLIEQAPEERPVKQTAPEQVQPQTASEPVVRRAENITLESLTPEAWISIYPSLNTSGLLQSTVANCQFIESQLAVDTNQNENVFIFVLDEQQSTLYDESHQQRFSEILSDYFEAAVRAVIRVGQVTAETPAQFVIRQQQQLQQQAEAAIEADPLVQQLRKDFDATIVDNSIMPINEVS